MDKDNLIFLLVLFAVCASLVVQFYYPGPNLSERTRIYYDCRIAEISPDVPPLVKQECRKLQERHR